MGNFFVPGLAPRAPPLATMRITNFLFSTGGHRCWSENRLDLEHHMRTGMRNGVYTSWYQACESAMLLPLRSWNHYYYDSDSDSDSDLDFDDEYYHYNSVGYYYNPHF